MHPDRAGQEAELNRRMREAAAALHWVLTRGDLEEIGLSRHMISSRKQAGRLISVLRGSFALPGTRLSEQGRYRASVYAGGQGCCLSHWSALAHHGLVRDRGPVHILRESGAGGDRASRFRHSRAFGFTSRIHQTRSLPEDQIQVVEGIRVASVERALLDSAAEATDQELGKALSQGERMQALCWKTLNELIADSRSRKGQGRLRKEVERFEPAFVDAGSDPEEDFLRLLREEELPIPSTNQRIGPYVLDFLWRELNLGAELDPYGTHKGYESFHRDRRKSLELERLGLRMIRFTWEDQYHHPRRLVAELRDIMRQQARLLGVTGLAV